MAIGDDKPTVRLDAADVKVSWPLAIATLEQIDPRLVFALRLGLLTFIQQCINQAKEPDAKAVVVVNFRTYVEWLAHVPWET